MAEWLKQQARNGIGSLISSANRAVSDREAMLTMLSGAVAEPAAGIAGLYGLATGGTDQGARNVEATRNALTYAPRNASSLESLGQALDPITSRLEAGKRYMGDGAMAKTGSPGMATAAYIAPEVLATLLGARMSGVKGPTMAQMAERSRMPTSGSPAAQRGAIGAWHGSPHDFDSFSMDKLGTGEGQQAFGHGLYFAGRKDVAEGYRDALAPEGNGRLYDVELSPDESDLLDWDAPLSGQPEKVRAALLNAGIDPDTAALSKGAELAQTNGHLFDSAIKRAGFKPGDPRSRAEWLNSIGIPGARYLDGGSRNMDSLGIQGDAGLTSRNYVMFDDKLINVRGKR